MDILNAHSIITESVKKPLHVTILVLLLVVPEWPDLLPPAVMAAGSALHPPLVSHMHLLLQLFLLLTIQNNNVLLWATHTPSQMPH